MKKIIQINGMKCEHCTSRVEEALKKVPNVKSVKVNLAKKEAIINGDVDNSILEETIKNVGYEVVSISVKKGLFE